MQDRKQARESSTELCFPFALGRCRFGDGCRFSHDIAAYLAARPADLPGRCPFSATGACPYGQCRSDQPLPILLGLLLTLARSLVGRADPPCAAVGITSHDAHAAR